MDHPTSSTTHLYFDVMVVLIAGKVSKWDLDLSFTIFYIPLLLLYLSLILTLSLEYIRIIY
jgi:hypothetical protein